MSLKLPLTGCGLASAPTPVAHRSRPPRVSFTVPAGLGRWHLFSDSYYLVALTAWERELRRP